MRAPEGDARGMGERLRVDVGEVTLAVRRWAPSPGEGAGVPVVLLPGTGASSATWDVVARLLARGRPVIAVDLRGHGASTWPGVYSIDGMAADVAALVPRLADRPVDLVGHSLGGLVALRAAARHPHLVRRIVLEDVGMLHEREPAPPERPAGDLPFDWRVVEQVRPEVDHPAPDWPDVVAAVTAPTLVVAGGEGSFVRLEHVDELVGALPDARAVVLGTGHDVHEERPDAFAAAAAGFLGG